MQYTFTILFDFQSFAVFDGRYFCMLDAKKDNQLRNGVHVKEKIFEDMWCMFFDVVRKQATPGVITAEIVLLLPLFPPSDSIGRKRDDAAGTFSIRRTLFCALSNFSFRWSLKRSSESESESSSNSIRLAVDMSGRSPSE